MHVRLSIGVCRSFTCRCMITIIQALVAFYGQEVTYSKYLHLLTLKAKVIKSSPIGLSSDLSFEPLREDSQSCHARRLYYLDL